MYNLKKVIASICVIAMMLTTVAFAATYSDVAEDSAYYEAIETLNKLGIVTGYEDGTYKPEAGVTRAEMAALIARIQGYGEAAAAQTATSFVDVPSSHWASGYVASAASTGIINGYGDGNFGPDDSVLFEQAVKMVMAALGYTPYAEYNGGYPGGYLAAAQRYNVTANVSNATMGTEANRGTIAQLLANAIDTPLMQQVGWTTNGEVDYVICDGKNGNDYKTLMSEYLNVVKIRGVVTENAYTNINDDKAIDLEDDATVVIDVVDAYDTTNKDFPTNNNGELTDAPDYYLVGESDAADYIGKSVIAYVQEVDDEWVIVSIVEDTTRNDILTIDLTQFNQINEDTDKFEYYKTTTAKTATAVALDDEVAVVYNNVGGYALEDVFGEIVAEDGATLYGGAITLIDNDDEKGYDVIFVEVAETAVVKDAEEGYVAFQVGTAINDIVELEVDEDDTDKVVVVVKDGEEIALADLVEWDVLSIIAASDDAAYILAEVASNQVVGTVTSESNSTTSATGKAYKIEGAKYDVAEAAYNRDDIKVGEGGTFYIDKYGKIAAFNEDSALASGTADNYAYVTAVAFDEDILTGKDTAIIQMVTADGVVALNLKATGAKVNGSTVDVDNADDADEIEALAGKVVKYAKNSANNITNIADIAETDKFDSVVLDSDREQEFDAEDGCFIGPRVYLEEDALVFFIAEEAEDSYIGAVADLGDGEYYDVKAYFTKADSEEDNSIIVLAATEGVAGKKAGLAVITSVGTSENEDGEQILAIEAIVNGEEIAAETTYEVFEDVEANLTAGDIVKIKTGANGVVSAIEIVFDFNEDVRAKANAANEIADYALDFTQLYTATSVDGEFIIGGRVEGYKNSSVAFSAEEEAEMYRLTQAANVIVVDANGRKLEVKKGSASSFKAYEALYKNDTVKVTIDDEDFGTVDADDAKDVTDYVFVRKYDNKIVDVVIVKGPADTKIR